MGDTLTVFQALDPEASAAVTGREHVQSVSIVHHLDTNGKWNQISAGNQTSHVNAANISHYSSTLKRSGRDRFVKLFSACAVCGRIFTGLWLISGCLYLKRVLVGAGDQFSSVLYNLCTSDAGQLNRTSPELFLLMQTICQQQLFISLSGSPNQQLFLDCL